MDVRACLWMILVGDVVFIIMHETGIIEDIKYITAIRSTA